MFISFILPVLGAYTRSVELVLRVIVYIFYS